MEMLRLKNLFGPQMIGNDLPSQGGITGNMPIPGTEFSQFPQQEMEPAFGQQSPIPPPVPQQQPMIQPEYSAANRMREIYQPENTASDAFNKLQGEYPVDQKLGWGRAIASMLTDYKYGNKAGMELANQPNEQRREDWKNRIGPAQAAANIERQENVNSRTLAHNTISNELRQQAQEAKEKNDTKRADIAQQRADVYSFKSKNPNLKFNFDGPFVTVADPASGKMTTTQIPSTSMTDLDKLELGQKNALERITATGGQARETENTRQGNRETQARITGEQNRQTKEVIPGKAAGVGGSGNLSPTQDKVKLFTAASKIKNTRPDLAKWIRFGGGANNFVITPPSKGGFMAAKGPTADEYAEIEKAIYGTAKFSPPAQSNNTTTPTGSSGSGVLTKMRRNKKTGKVVPFVSNDGGETWQPQ